MPSDLLEKIDAALHAALLKGTQDENLVDPCRDLLDRGGKRWRPLLLVHCACLADSAATDRGIALCPLVEFPHTASLIHDDIEDASDLRRGSPAVHITYGIDRALNAASWLYFQGEACIDDASNALPPETRLRLHALYGEEIRRLHQGQGQDIAWHRDKSYFPPVRDYFTMVTRKTGALPSLASQAGLIAGGCTDGALLEKAGALAAQIGAAFQILDDIANLSTGNPGKKRGDDIVEGKKSYPVLLHLESCPADREKLAGHFERARIDGIDSPAVAAAINLIQASGALERSDADARASLEQAADAFAALFPQSAETAAEVAALFRGLAPKV